MALTERMRDARDLAILELAAAGLSEGEIARELNCTRKSVRHVLAEDARAFPDEPLIATAPHSPEAC